MNRVLLFGIGTVVTLLALFVAAVFVIDAGKRDVIADGVRIGTLDVGGLERDQARELVRRELTGSVGKSVTATHGNRRFVLKPERAKARLDVDATVDAAIRRSREGTAFSRVLFGEDVRGTVTPRVAFSRAAARTSPRGSPGASAAPRATPTSRGTTARSSARVPSRASRSRSPTCWRRSSASCPTPPRSAPSRFR